MLLYAYLIRIFYFKISVIRVVGQTQDILSHDDLSATPFLTNIGPATNPLADSAEPPKAYCFLNTLRAAREDSGNLFQSRGSAQAQAILAQEPKLKLPLLYRSYQSSYCNTICPVVSSAGEASVHGYMLKSLISNHYIQQAQHLIRPRSGDQGQHILYNYTP
jgi:hypothetical protein